MVDEGSRLAGKCKPRSDYIRDESKVLLWLIVKVCEYTRRTPEHHCLYVVSGEALLCCAVPCPFRDLRMQGVSVQGRSAGWLANLGRARSSADVVPISPSLLHFARFHLRACLSYVLLKAT